jgi:hypothetical protein
VHSYSVVPMTHEYVMVGRRPDSPESGDSGLNDTMNPRV